MLYSLERLAAFILLVLWAPALVVMGLLIKLTSPGPAIYRQIRLGQGGRKFAIYKLRTMFVGAHEGRVVSPEDPRITKIGRFLRRTRLDEIPQLWNIVRGEMAFVGPRPHSKAGSEELQKKFGKRYANRYLLRPGICGLAQVLWTRQETYRRMVACDELFRLYRSKTLGGWILGKALADMFKRKTF